MKQKVDISVLREGKQVNVDYCRMLTAQVTYKEIHSALKKINNLTAPRMDGYGAQFYKAAWPIIKKDIMVAIQYFFVNKRMYKVVNSTLVIMIPKNVNACMMKDYRPISCCTILYKLI